MSGETRDGGDGRRPFRVGGAKVRPDLNRIRRPEGETVSVEPRVMDLLVELARNAGKVVPREALLRSVWGGAVVGEKALTRAVWSLRQALGDDPKRPAAVETIRKGGYRLIAPVEWEDPSPPAARRTPSRRPFLYAAAAILFPAAILLWRFLPGGGRDEGAAPLPRTTPFTSYPGREYAPSFSPEGTRVAFAWDGPEGGDFDIYVKQRNAETPLRLTGGGANDNLPVWSADGGTVYFVRREEDLFSIRSVPAIGGEVRDHYITARIIGGLAASPAGETLAFSEQCSSGTSFRIALLSPESGARRWLTDPPAWSRGDFHPAFSPDGARVAFSRSDPAGFHRIHVVPAAGGPAIPAGRPRRLIRGLGFLDGGELIVASLRSGAYALWRFSLAGGRWTGVPAQDGSIGFPAVSPEGETILYESARSERSIHAVDLTAPSPRLSGKPLIESTRSEDEPRFSPDGTRIAFVSDRTGFPELWICGADGSAPEPLTRMRREALLSPCWSPEGGKIAFFASSSDGEGGVYQVEPGGGPPRALLRGEALHLPSSWSADGRFLYLDSNRDGRWRVWRLGAEGGAPVPAVPGEACRARESADGRYLYYGRVRETGIWRKPAAGGPEERVLSAGEIGAGLWGNWDLAGGRIYFRDAGGIAVRDAEGGAPRRLVDAPGVAPLGLSVSPDGTGLLVAIHRNAEADLVLLEDFR